jgi:hypothetical protein
MSRRLPKILAVAALVAGAVALTTRPAFTQDKDYRSVEALKKLGVSTCAGAVSTITKFMYDEDDFAYLNTWNEDKTDRHTTLTVASKNYSDGSSVASIAVSPTTAGTCDANFTQLTMVKETCAKLRDTTFKEWKYYSDLGTNPMYEDPTSDSVVVTLANTADGCLIIKTGLLFLQPGAAK